jgi:hypothetical protein
MAISGKKAGTMLGTPPITDRQMYRADGLFFAATTGPSNPSH